MNIIDFHTHIYPKPVAQKAVQSVSSFYQIKIDRKGTPEALLADGVRAGIHQFVVHSVAIAPKHVKNINNFIAETCQEHPEFIGFGTLHAEMEDPNTEIERILTLGLHGIKLHPDTQLFNLDDPKAMAIFERLEGRLPVLIHCGDYRYTYSHPARLAKVLDAFPKLTVIAAHFGGWSLQDLALEYLEHRNCYLDTSSSMMYLGNRRSAELIRAYGAERFLFGSDFPMWSPTDELERFLALGLTSAENRLILQDNAIKILNHTH